MKTGLFLVLVALCCWSLSSCKAGRYMRDISQVTYISESGTILPERQIVEQVVIAADKVTLTRKGKTPDTIINEGVWEFVPDTSKVAAFFAQLEAVDCTAIKRVEPNDPPDGSGAETYRIVYAGGKMFDMQYSEGASYTNGILLTEPIAAFIKDLALPTEAAYPYRP